jgi:[protein-PII] uridylyltransferase
MIASAPTERLGAVPATRHCLDLKALEQLPKDPVRLSAAIDLLREHADTELARLFDQGAPIGELVHARAWVVEQLVIAVFETLVDPSDPLCLCAVGGFGRGELHPHSDVDLLIIHADTQQLPETLSLVITHFVQVLWDAHLHPGHSVRTIDECLIQAKQDVTVMTNLTEMRMLSGKSSLFTDLSAQLSDPNLWPADAFFRAKTEEQAQRYAQFEDTIYNLEPNLKEGPGGLRDIQMIAWVTERHFKTATLHGLVEHDFLSEAEYDELVRGREYLWSLRWALHQLAGRGEERLLFDYQRQLAKQLGHVTDEAVITNEAVEQFMQGFYQVAMRLARLNERLLQSFEEELLANRAHLPSGPIDEDFQIKDGYLELVNPQGFVYKPILLMRMFNVLASHPEIIGVRANTIRLVRAHLYLIDEDFRSDPAVMDWFLKLLKSPQGVYHQLARMNRYGILAALLPAFSAITGRMQFDLFHVYTVDQHTLFVIRNLRRFANRSYPELYRHATMVFERIDRPELLYLAALFHDIAKGRGGDHSELGAEDARVFCEKLPLDVADRQLVTWLVKEHLIMSLTSQREDISDPLIVNHFAERVGNRRHLDYLFVLTVADIAATSPSLWNSWKDSLLWSLYESTVEAFDRGLNDPVKRAEGIRRARGDALAQFAKADRERVETLWETLPERAFLRLDIDQLVWTTTCALHYAKRPLVVIQSEPNKGVSEIFVHAPDFAGLFALVARELDRMQLNVVAARVITTHDGLSWDLFQVMTQDAQPLGSEDAVRLSALLSDQLVAQTVRPLPPRPVPRRLQPFMGQAEIKVSSNTEGLTTLEVNATDRPGLLSAIAETLVGLSLRLQDARIATFGQRVEDVFVIGQEVNGSMAALDEAQTKILMTELTRRLDA